MAFANWYLVLDFAWYRILAIVVLAIGIDIGIMYGIFIWYWYFTA